MANAYNYSNTAVQTTLSGNISAGATSLAVGATTGFPPATPYVLAVDYGAATEELVVVTGVGGTTLTVTRGFSGTSAQSHSIGAVVRHVVNAQDLTDFRTHEAATASVHGVTGALVGATQTQTLTNKTLTSPVVNGGTMSGTFAGTHTYSGAVTLAGGGTLTGTFTGNPTLSGSPVLSGSPLFSGTPSFTGEISHTNLLRGSRAAATDSQYESRVAGDSSARWFVRAGGEMWWGPGNAIGDTRLYRPSAGLLKTDTRFEASNWPAGAWTDWTPAWTTSTGLHLPSYGDATIDSSYVKLGRTVFFRFEVVFGDATRFGTSVTTIDNWQFTLPVAASGVHSAIGFVALDATGGIRATARMRCLTTTQFGLEVSSGKPDGSTMVNTGLVDSLTPWVWTSGHAVRGTGCYEAAA